MLLGKTLQGLYEAFCCGWLVGIVGIVATFGVVYETKAFGLEY